jgi:hypothetical protein
MTAAKRAGAGDADPLLKGTAERLSDNTSPIANQAFDFHPLADIFPLMEGAEFDELVADIAANKLRDKILLYEGMILDGRNRYRALRKLGLGPEQIREHCCVTRCCIDSDHGGPAAYVISANIHRRHLTAEQKRELIARLLKMIPEASDRQIAKQAKVSDKTVGAVRREKEARAEIPHVSTRTDTRGRKQPAKKPEAKKPATRKPTKRDHRIISQVAADACARFAYTLIRLDLDLARELAALIISEPGVPQHLWIELTTGIDIEEVKIEGNDAGDAAS